MIGPFENGFTFSYTNIWNLFSETIPRRRLNCFRCGMKNHVLPTHCPIFAKRSLPTYCVFVK